MGCLDEDEYIDVKGYKVRPHKRRKPKKGGCLSLTIFLTITMIDKFLILESEMLFINKLNFLNNMVIKSIKLYQKLTKNREHKCIYHPTCSNFAITAYEKYLFLIATKKTIARLNDCRPFSKRNYIDYP
jgi:putative component of membrane protein insertase Oxa1/YidC/SpoIIIJ protein YidD